MRDAMVAILLLALLALLVALAGLSLATEGFSHVIR